MIFGSNHKRRPLPIEVLKLEDRQEDDADDPTLRTTSPILPMATNAASPTSLASKLSFNHSMVPQEPARTISTFRTSATIATQRESPTRTTFITTEHLSKSPKDKDGDSPEPTQTVFISAPTQIVTVTVSAVVVVPTAETLRPPVPETKGVSVIPHGALVPVTVFSVVAGIAIIFTVLITVWKKKRGLNKKGPLEQRAMAESDESAFRTVPDTRPILS